MLIRTGKLHDVFIQAKKLIEQIVTAIRQMNQAANKLALHSKS